MNPIKITWRSKFHLILSVITLATLLSSCMGDLEAPDFPTTAYVSIYQGSPDAPAMDIFANQNKVNRDPMLFSQALPYNAFFPGDRDFRFASFNSATSLLEKDFKLEADSVYSLFVVNESSNLDAVLVKDEWEEPKAESAQLRLVHLSPDTENVSLEISQETTQTIENIAFKGASEFIEIPKGTTTLVIKSKTTNQTLLTSDVLDLKGNRVYSVLIRGLKAESSGNKKLDLQILTNYINY